MRALLFAIIVVTFGFHALVDARKSGFSKSSLRGVTGVVGSVELRREALKRKSDVPSVFLLRDSTPNRLHNFAPAKRARPPA